MRFQSEFSISSSRICVPHFIQPFLQKSERVVPKCIDLNSLASARRHDPITHLCIHPSQLISLHSLDKQSIVRIDVNIKLRSAEMMLGNVDQGRQKKRKRNTILGLL